MKSAHIFMTIILQTVQLYRFPRSFALLAALMLSTVQKVADMRIMVSCDALQDFEAYTCRRQGRGRSTDCPSRPYPAIIIF